MKKTLLTAIVLATLVACKTTKEAPKAETAVVVAKPALDCSTLGLTYSSIKSIIDNSCISCHNYGEDGGYNFMLIADVKKSAQNGTLLATIKYERGFPRMPANGQQLDQASIDKIECWIKNGMKE